MTLTPAEMLRTRAERALAALAGSGLDSTRFSVTLDPVDGAGQVGQLDRSATAVLAVMPGELNPMVDELADDERVAWVADFWAEPGVDPLSHAASGPLASQVVGSVAQLRAALTTGAETSAGWLVIDSEVAAEVTDDLLLAALGEAIEGGASPSRAAKAVAAKYGVAKRRVYDLALSGSKVPSIGSNDG